MTAKRKVSLVGTAVVVACLAASAFMVGPLQRTQPDAAGDDVLYIPSPRAIKYMSLGYTGLAADIYWTRAVQYFGRNLHEGVGKYPLLYPLLKLTTDLDPKMTVAYQFGSAFLASPAPEGAGQPDKAVELVERGIQANPDDWHLYLSLGFIHYQYMHDFRGAAAAFERGSHVPGSHPALRVLAAVVEQQGGDEQKAAMLWRAIYDSTEEEAVKENAAAHLIALRVDSDVTQLEALVKQFQERTGRLPSNFAEMVASRWLSAIPKDPTGQPYKLMPDGRVEVESPSDSDLRYITKGLPPGYQPNTGLHIPGMR